MKTYLENEKIPPTYLSLQCALLPPPQLRAPRLSLFAQIGKLLDLGLVEAINNRVLPLLNMYALDLDNNQYTSANKIVTCSPSAGP